MEKNNKIPPNIYDALVKYSANLNDVLYPETIKLNNISEFSSIRHKDMLIDFKPGGEVGDNEWRTQYMHNMAVLTSYNEKKQKKENPEKIFYAPETYIQIPKSDISEIINISEYYDQILINQVDFIMLSLVQEMYDIKPPLTNIETDAETNIYYINTYGHLGKSSSDIKTFFDTKTYSNIKTYSDSKTFSDTKSQLIATKSDKTKIVLEVYEAKY